MQENDIGFEEFDLKTDGKDAFNKFFRTNRDQIFRDKDGVEFPIFSDGKVIKQGVSVVIGYLLAKDGLSGFIGRSLLRGQWIDGFDVSGGDPQFTEELITVLSYLKKSGLKTTLNSSGRNSQILKRIVDEGLADRVRFTVRGPVELYSQILGEDIDVEDITESIRQAVRVSDYHFNTVIAPLIRADNTVSYLTPDEVAATAEMIEKTTGSKKHPYKLSLCDLELSNDERLKSVSPLEPSEMFKYRTAARRFMVMTEIDK
jgi:pyruvate formate lyase activating enzyme